MRADAGALRILGTHHVAIHTPDLPRLPAFYVETLGPRVAGGFPEHGIAFVEAGGTLVELIEEPAREDGGASHADGTVTEADPVHESSADADDALRGGWNHLAWLVADVDAAYADLAARGVPVRSPPEDFPPEAPVVRIAFFADPDGNLLELLQPLTPAG